MKKIKMSDVKMDIRTVFNYTVYREKFLLVIRLSTS